MAKILVARGQATINIQKDGYTLSQSPGEYIFPADADGKIVSAVSVTSSVKVTLGDSGFTGFSVPRTLLVTCTEMRTARIVHMTVEDVSSMTGSITTDMTVKAISCRKAAEV